MTMSYQLPWVRTLAMILLLLSQGSGSYENLWHRCCSSESSFCTLDDLSDSLTLSREQSLPHSFRSDVSINMISFSSTDILDYAIYSYIVDAAYAEHRGYTLQLHNKPVYEPRDHRWNRVKLIENLLRSHEVDRAAVEEPVYYVWFDADLIFINFSFAIESVIDQYPHADIIISAERHAETGIANTGCFIIKNTEWSRSFVSKWWNNYDRTQNHDQVFFDVLYKSLPESEVLQHIAILPANVLNSVPPPMFFQQPTDAVLHLMGAPAMLRIAVFQRAAMEVCQALDGNASHLRPQLGLSRSVLQEEALSYYQQSINSSQQVLMSFLLRPPAIDADSSQQELADVGIVIKAIAQSREDALQVRSILLWRRSADISAAGHFDDLLRKLALTPMLLRYATKQVLATVQTSSSFSSASRQQLLVQLLNLLAILNNDMLSDWDDINLSPIPSLQSRADFDLHILSALIDEYSSMTKFKLLKETEETLLRLIASVTAESSVPIVEQLALHYRAMGLYHDRAGDEVLALDYLQRSVKMITELVGGNQFHAIQPLLSLGEVYCRSGGERVTNGLQVLLNLLVLLDKRLLFMEKQVSAEYVHLAYAYVNIAYCLRRDGYDQMASEFLNRTVRIQRLLQHSEPMSLAHLNQQISELHAALSSQWDNCDNAIDIDGDIQGELITFDHERLATDRLAARERLTAYLKIAPKRGKKIYKRKKLNRPT